MAEVYSPLRYPGGKSRLAPFLVEVLRSNDITEPHYIEPYAGGAGAALQMLFEEYVESITINDADPRVYCFWKAVTEHNEQFLSLLENAVLTVEEWHRQRDVYGRCDKRSTVSLGFATFFLNRTSRSGILHNSGPIGGYKQTGNYKIDVRFNRQKLARRIQRIGAYSERINVSNLDGLALLKVLNRAPTKARNSFVYLDPPYYVKGAELYMNKFNHAQHRILAKYLSKPRNFPWIMTYDNAPEIRHLYRNFSQSNFDLSYSAYERRVGKELLIHPNSISIPDSAKESLPYAA